MKRRRQHEASRPIRDKKPRLYAMDDQPILPNCSPASAEEIPELPDNVLWAIIENFGCDTLVPIFRLVCKQYARAVDVVIPSYAFIKTILEDANTKQSVWITPLEVQRSADLQKLTENSAIPKPSEAPLLAIEAMMPGNIHLKLSEQPRRSTARRRNTPMLPAKPTVMTPKARATVMKSLPRLPASVFQLLVVEDNSPRHSHLLEELSRAIRMLRINTAYKLNRKEKLKETPGLVISENDMNALFNRLNITQVDIDAPKRTYPKFTFNFPGIDGTFQILNEHLTLGDDFILSFDRPVHFDFTTYLHLQQKLGFTGYLLPNDFVTLLYSAVGGCMAKVAPPTVSASQKMPSSCMAVDPSCQVSKCQLFQNGKYSVVTTNTDNFYAIIQIVNDSSTTFCHLRVGMLNQLMIYPHFVATTPVATNDIERVFNYWVNGLMALGFSVVDEKLINSVLYCEKLGRMAKDLVKSRDDESKAKLAALQKLLPNNPLLIAKEIEMQDFITMKMINELIELDYGNFYIWELKIRLLEYHESYEEAIQCVEVVLKLIEEETEGIHEKLYFRRKFMKKHTALRTRRVLCQSLSKEESLMLIIYHPSAIAHAKKFRESSSEYRVALELIEEYESNANAPYLFPIAEIAAKIQKIKKFVRILEDQFTTEIVDRPAHFYRVNVLNPPKVANVLWYFTHPINLPSILKNGITIEGGYPAHFYSCFMTYEMAAHEFGVDQFCIISKNGNKFFAAVLVELDLTDSIYLHSVPHLPLRCDKNPYTSCIQIGNRYPSSRKQGATKNPLILNTSETRQVVVFDPSRIGNVRYFGIVSQRIPNGYDC